MTGVVVPLGARQSMTPRGGVRWTLPLGGRVNPCVLIQGEFGDVQRETYALGVSVPGAWDFQIEYREDEQYFSEDRTALLGVARYRDPDPARSRQTRPFAMQRRVLHL